MSFNPVFEYLLAYMVFVGFLQGLVESLFFLVNLEIAGKNGYRTACGFTLALTSVSMTTGPPLAGRQITPRLLARMLSSLLLSNHSIEITRSQVNHILCFCYEI